MLDQKKRTYRLILASQGCLIHWDQSCQTTFVCVIYFTAKVGIYFCPFYAHMEIFCLMSHSISPRFYFTSNLPIFFITASTGCLFNILSECVAGKIILPTPISFWRLVRRKPPKYHRLHPDFYFFILSFRVINSKTII